MKTPEEVAHSLTCRCTACIVAAIRADRKAVVEECCKLMCGWCAEGEMPLSKSIIQGKLSHLKPDGRIAFECRASAILEHFKEVL